MHETRVTVRSSSQKCQAAGRNAQLYLLGTASSVETESGGVGEDAVELQACHEINVAICEVEASGSWIS